MGLKRYTGDEIHGFMFGDYRSDEPRWIDGKDTARDLPALLRAAERRVNAHVWPQPGRDDHLASIPANRDTDTDLLLLEAADKLERIQTAFQALRDGKEHASSNLYRVLATEFPPQSDAAVE